MELANVQLEELEAYDVFIDEALERAYRDLSSPRSPRRGGILRELKTLRIDLARFSEELSNITKFFGEWHLARVYENTARLFHLADWHRAIDEKLKTLDSLYEMLKQDRDQRLMVWLEVEHHPPLHHRPRRDLHGRGEVRTAEPHSTARTPQIP